MLALAGGVSHAQRPGQADEAHCANAARIIEKGHPAKKEQDAFLTLMACGTVGSNALARGIGTYASDGDTLALDDFMRQADNWRDSTIMEAAIALATNSGATAESRVFAVRHLLVLVHPYMRFSYGGLTSQDSAGSTPDLDVSTMGCPASLGSEAPDLVGTPLPADYAARIHTVLTSLANDASAPAPVRRAAHCMG